MKPLLPLLFFLFTSIAYSQAIQFEGEFEKRTETKEGAVHEYSLSIKPNGTFTFHWYRNIDPTQPKENKYGKGTWEVTKKKILFSTDEAADLDEKYTLNFTGTKARFIQKTPRGESTANKKTYLLFYDSDIRWIKGLKLTRK